MLRRFIILILILMWVLPGVANPRWKMHITFDGEIDNIFETPVYVYFTSRAMADMNGERRMSLFRYDKEGDEILPLSPDNVLSSPTISMAQYCPQKGYVVVVNANYDLTFLYDDGKTVTMPDYRLASLSHNKTITGITIDPWHDRLYLSTKFGYIAVNDEKHEIAESRIYGEELASVARVGTHMILLHGNKLMSADVAAPRFSLSDYDSKDFGSLYYAAPLTATECLVFDKSGGSQRMFLLKEEASELSFRQLDSNAYYSIVNNKNGVLTANRTSLVQIAPGGEMTTLELPEADYKLRVGSYDLAEIWHGKERKGIKSSKPGDNPAVWSVTREFMLPNSPSPFVTPDMETRPNGEVLVPIYGYDYVFLNYPQNVPMLLSGYKDGWWNNYSPAYTNESRATMMHTINGVAVDPDNPDYIYVTSTHNGIARLNLADGDDIIHLSRPADPDNGNPGFIKFVENQQGKNNWCCNFSPPKFDSNGNMWMAYSDLDNQTPPRLHLYCWEAQDRRATTSAENIQLPKKLEVECDYKDVNNNVVIPLKHRSNSTKLVFSSRTTDGLLVLIDTKGTPTEGADDEVVKIMQHRDQYGDDFKVSNIRYIWEDISTGNVWVCHSEGAFYFNPADFFNGNAGTLYRIKVARNDGTNLADYLFDGVIVCNVTTDNTGRKWFATIGGGVSCTSSDGRTIEQQLNTSNSPLPSDDVYGIHYIPSSNSLLISTSEGLTEHYLTGTSSGEGNEDLKIYPNPVRPDYFGYVTIEGLPDRALVKIVDSAGNIVKEFGPVSGDVQWDVTNHQFKRVGSGVYFVLASAGENESAFSTVGKILVVN